jgi:hypothetical protein
MDLIATEDDPQSLDRALLKSDDTRAIRRLEKECAERQKEIVALEDLITRGESEYSTGINQRTEHHSAELISRLRVQNDRLAALKREHSAVRARLDSIEGQRALMKRLNDVRQQVRHMEDLARSHEANLATMRRTYAELPGKIEEELKLRNNMLHQLSQLQDNLKALESHAT